MTRGEEGGRQDALSAAAGGWRAPADLADSAEGFFSPPPAGLEKCPRLPEPPAPVPAAAAP